ncbi:three-helix bundle dimerization domain-containing protein [Streptomyces sp. NPDC059533]|uniref:three-helix bundle dimerization domain-containing protein n=1 Tax=unclassified Streptomyces TaxID=2593676 RepID=UPI00369F3792
MRDGRFCGLEVVEHGIGTAMTIEDQTHRADVRPPAEGLIDLPGPVERADPAAPPSPSRPGSTEESASIRDMVARLGAAFPSVDAATVEATVRAEYDSFREARIRAFIPILVERRSRRALGAASEQTRTDR